MFDPQTPGEGHATSLLALKPLLLLHTRKHVMQYKHRFTPKLTKCGTGHCYSFLREKVERRTNSRQGGFVETFNLFVYATKSGPKLGLLWGKNREKWGENWNFLWSLWKSKLKTRWREKLPFYQIVILYQMRISRDARSEPGTRYSACSYKIPPHSLLPPYPSALSIDNTLPWLLEGGRW